MKFLNINEVHKIPVLQQKCYMTKGKMKKTPLHIIFQGFQYLFISCFLLKTTRQSCTNKSKPPAKQFMKDTGGTGRKKETRKTLNLVFGCT